MRTVKTATKSATTSADKPQHFINFNDASTGAKVGYMTLDSSTEIDNSSIIELCQENPDFAQFYFGNESLTARYSQAGVSKAKSVKSKAELLAEFKAKSAKA